MNTQLHSAIVHVRYKDEKNGFCILELKATNEDSKKNIISQTGKEYFIATGILHNPSIGSLVTCEGQWITHPQRGLQFKTTSMFLTKLIKQEHALAVLESRLFKSIDKKDAARLFSVFGDGVFEAIDKNPSLLKEKANMPIEKIMSISKEWFRAKKLKESFNFLKSLDANTDVADRILETFGNQSKEVVTTNPYSLIGINGLGFRSIDPIALKNGIDTSSLNRIHHGISFTMKTITDRGSTSCYLDEFTRILCKTIEINNEEARKVVDDMIAAGELAAITDKMGTPMIVSFDLCKKEQSCAKEIARLVKTPFTKKQEPVRITDPLLVKEQKQAIYVSAFSKVSIVTGGPGVGKTTVTKNILDVLEKNDENKHSGIVKLIAPTGKAARRMAKATGKDAETIHSLLDYNPETGFNKNENNQLNVDTVIVDESSMIDIHVFHALLKAIPSHARLIIIGDVDQLPSVDVGNVLFDLIESKTIPVTRLVKVHRQGQNSQIIINAHKINNGEMPDLDAIPKDFHWINASTDEDIAKTITYLMSKEIPVKHGLIIDDIQVLSPQKGTIAGVDHLNELLRNAANPSESTKFSINSYGNDFYVNDRIMQIKNNKTLGLSNGEIGKIMFLDYGTKTAKVDFDGRKLQMPFSAFGDVRLAYATTIHKSQGSEFGAVIIPLSESHSKMLTPQLLYTAMTRGKKQVYFVGSKSALEKAMKNTYRQVRQTTLKGFLREFLPVIKKDPLEIIIENNKNDNSQLKFG